MRITVRRLLAPTLLLCSLLVLLGAKTARANSYYQATVTPTWQPLFPTSTPVPTKNYTCPSGTPFGWGVITPEAIWKSVCADCVPTSTPGQFWTPVVTGTPPTATPVASATPTASPTPSVGGYPDFQSIVDYLGSYDTKTDQNNRTYYVHHVGSGAASSGASYTRTVQFATWKPCGKEAGIDSSYYVHVVGVATYSVRSRTYINSSGNINLDNISLMQIYNCPLNTDCSGNVPVDVTYHVVNEVGYSCPSNSKTLYYFAGGVQTGGITFAGQVEYYRDGYSSNPTPTPTATPGSNYCDQVNNGRTTPDTANDYFGLSVPRRGTGQCFTTPSLTIGVSIIAAIFEDWIYEDFGIPGVSMCFVPIEFGQIDLFGMTISLDDFIGAAVAAMVLRWLWRS